MMKYMTRPGTPEQNKRAEENNKKYLADRRARTRKEYGLPPEDNSQKDMQTWVKNTTALNKKGETCLSTHLPAFGPAALSIKV